MALCKSTESSHEPASECSTTWSPINDDDGQQQTALGFCEIFIKGEPHEAEECFEEPESETSVESDPLMRPSICSTSADVNAKQVGRLNRHLFSPVKKYTKPTVEAVKLFSCKRCSYTTPRIYNLKLHIRQHTGEKPFSCEYCGHKSSQLSNLKNHLITHSAEKPFSCEFCDYKCTKSGRLKDHLRTHTGEKPFSCEFCDYKCASSTHLAVHLSRKHSSN